MGRRLAEPEAGFEVVRVAAERGLAETLEHHLGRQAGLVGELLVYFSGYTVLSQERGPALLLDGERLGTFSLRRLRGLFARFSHRACLIVDAAALVDSGQSLDAVVTGIGEALTEGVPSISALVAVRDSSVPDSFGGSAFTGLMLTALDWLAVSREAGEAVDIERLYEALRAEPALFQEIPATGLFGGMEPRLSILQPGVPPQRAARAEGPRKVRAEASAPLPSFADLPNLDADLAALLGFEAQPEPVREEPTPALARGATPPGAFEQSTLEPRSSGQPGEQPGVLEQPGAVEQQGGLERSAFQPAPGLATPGGWSGPEQAILPFAQTEHAATPAAHAFSAAMPVAADAVPTEAPPHESVSPRDAARARAAELLSYYANALLRAVDSDELSRISAELAVLVRERQVSPARAALAWEACLARFPRDLDLREQLVEACTQASAPARALLHCQAAAQIAPLRAATYRRAQALFESVGAADGAWQAASVLEALGDADINESLLAHQHKPDGLLMPRGTVSDAEFFGALCPTSATVLLLPLLSVLARADAVADAALGIGFLKHKKVYQEPDPSYLHDAERSTAMFAKTLNWAARLFGQKVPSLYVFPELPSLTAPGTLREPSVYCARALGSGLSLTQLAFLWGRELPRQRPEFRMLAFFKRPDELAALIAASLTLAGVPGYDVRALSADAKRLYTALRRELSRESLESLRDAGSDIAPEELEQRAGMALAEFELLSVRAGLLACGDVVTA
ncbi:MAG TPA: hypothetical protein VFQ61_09330, partial [Polyangiaceae bacterium]|nr:hypothetical protein [Polyangiaceae bacterium]